MFADVKYQVFISSTYEDLRFERQQVTQAILELGHMAVGMELFPASDMRQSDLIKKVIDESDYYVVIVAGRYGSIDPSTGVSYTEMEYDYALKSGIPILGFVRGELGNIPASLVDSDKEKLEMLSAFRGKVMQRTCRKFSDANELGLQVLKSLVSEIRLAPRVGWVRADQAKSVADVDREQKLRDKIEKQKKKIDELSRSLRDQAIPLEFDARTPEGKDKFYLTFLYNDRDRQMVKDVVPFTYDELLMVIGPSMFGYIQRRQGRNMSAAYNFESDIITLARDRILDRVGNRQMNVVTHQIDLMLLHFKQMGIIEYAEIKEENEEIFRGLTLTEYGEKYLTSISLIQA